MTNSLQGPSMIRIVFTYCDDGIMVGKGYGGIHRSHVWGVDPTLPHLLNDRGQLLLQVVCTESIE